MNTRIFNELKERGTLKLLSNEEAIKTALSTQKVPIYVGFDPTATSLHVGNLLPLMILAHLQKAGHIPIVVIGGATGMIGDPSGRSTERQLLTPDIIKANSEAIKKQIQRFLHFEGENAAIMVDNAEWTSTWSYLDWLREIGKHFTVNYMLAKESVRRRLEENEQGISYTEFSYMLLQSYDFLHLFEHYGCLIQAGGNDQWGNITAGIEFIRRVRGSEAYGITFPLVTTANGEKFGKSAGNAIWLDAQKTSPYQFYQFWFKTDDQDVERYLKFFTFLPLEQINDICEAHQHEPEKRKAQRILAAEVTSIVHGKENLQKALQATEILFGREVQGLSDAELTDIFTDVPATHLDRQLLSSQLSVNDLLLQTECCTSRSEGRRLIQGGGVYLNNQRVEDSDMPITAKNLASETMLLLRIGKTNYHLVCFS